MPATRHLTLVLFAGATCLAAADVAQAQRDPYLARRLAMVKNVLERDGITNKGVLKSFRTVPRHEFVLPNDRKMAYYDMAIAIGYKQTISPPFIVAYMTQTIDPQPTDKILEIGTGSGYQAAILSGLAKEVYSIEIVPQLGRTAARRLERLGYKNVFTKVGDGFKGWPDKAPFDKIIVTCSPENVPQPLIDQLKEGGKMLIPLGERYQQVFYMLEKKDGKLTRKKLIPTLFVPMTGISEDKRKVKPDPTHPQVVNGSFELDSNKDGKTDSWHYQRLATRMTTDVPDGKVYIRLENMEPGRRSQLLQGMGIDGRRVKKFILEADVRYSRTARGPASYMIPGLFIHFFDSIRKPAGSDGFPAFLGTRGDWTKMRKTILVPPKAREAIVQFGLNGGTGQLDVDNIKITPVTN